MRQATSRWSALMHALAAIVGTLPVALFANACIARFLPLSAETRFAVAYAALIPTWLIAMCWAWLARSPLRVWLICLIATALLAGLTYGIPVEGLHACSFWRQCGGERDHGVADRRVVTDRFGRLQPRELREVQRGIGGAHGG